MVNFPLFPNTPPSLLSSKSKVLISLFPLTTTQSPTSIVFPNFLRAFTSHSRTTFQWTSTCIKSVVYVLSSMRIATYSASHHGRDTNMIACSVVGSRLDYANTVLHGVSSKNINHLQRVHNVLARCIVASNLHHGSNVLLQQLLHWLPYQYRIKLKIAKFTFLATANFYKLSLLTVQVTVNSGNAPQSILRLYQRQHPFKK